MAVTKSSTEQHAGKPASAALEQRAMLGSIGLVGIVAMLVASTWLRPGTVVAMSCALFVVGFGLALHAWMRGIPREVNHATPWDVAGLAVFAGFAGLIGANTALF